MEQRNHAIDNLRGVLTIYVIFALKDVYDLSTDFIGIVFGVLSSFIYCFHMPAFFACSGYFFHRTCDKRLKENLINKFITLFVPYILFSCAYWGIKYLMSSFVNSQMKLSDLLLIGIKPIEFMWYIYILFWINIVALLLNRLCKNKMVLFLLFVLSAILINRIYVPYPFDYLFRNMVYFYLGCILYEKRDKWYKYSSYTVLALTVSVILFVVHLVRDSGVLTYSSTDNLLKLVLALCFIFCLVSLFENFLSRKICFLTGLGENAMPIYMVHVIFGGGSRIILMRLGVDSLLVHTLVGTGVALLVPYLGYTLVIRKIPFIDFIFYPKRYVKKMND